MIKMELIGTDRGEVGSVTSLVIFLGFFSPLPSATEVPQGKLILKHFKGKENSSHQGGKPSRNM